MGWLLEILQKLAMYIVSQAICIPFLKKPFQDLSHPGRRYAIENAMNVRIEVGTVEKGEEIGGWFMQPSDITDRPLPKTDDEQFEERTMVYKTQVKICTENIFAYHISEWLTYCKFYNQYIFETFHKDLEIPDCK